MDVTPIPPASRNTARFSYGRGEGRSLFTERRSIERNEDVSSQDSNPTAPANSEAADPDIRADIRKLEQADTEVRSHEAAHLAAAGNLASGGAKFIYTRGPDGRYYAVAGEVRIQISSGRTPEETVARARQARSAALAPSNPSPQDLAVAAQAQAMEMAAQREMSAERSSSDTSSETRTSRASAMMRYVRSGLSPEPELWALA